MQLLQLILHSPLPLLPLLQPLLLLPLNKKECSFLLFMVVFEQSQHHQHSKSEHCKHAKKKVYQNNDIVDTVTTKQLWLKLAFAFTLPGNNYFCFQFYGEVQWGDSTKGWYHIEYDNFLLKERLCNFLENYAIDWGWVKIINSMIQCKTRLSRLSIRWNYWNLKMILILFCLIWIVTMMIPLLVMPMNQRRMKRARGWRSWGKF